MKNSFWRDHENREMRRTLIFLKSFINETNYHRDSLTLSLPAPQSNISIMRSITPPPNFNNSSRPAAVDLPVRPLQTGGVDHIVPREYTSPHNLKWRSLGKREVDKIRHSGEGTFQRHAS